MRYLAAVVLFVVLGCSSASAIAGTTPEEPEVIPSPVCQFDTFTLGATYDTEGDTITRGHYEMLNLSGRGWSGKFTAESWDDGYDRYTLYLGPKGCGNTGLLRWDDSSRLWLGANLTAKVSDEVTLTLRPMLGVKSNTENRVNVLASYSPADQQFGALLFVNLIDGDGATEDYLLGPTWRKENVNVWLAGNLSNGGWYTDVSYSVPFK